MKRPGLIRGMLVIWFMYACSGVIHRLNMHRCAHTRVQVQLDINAIAADELCAIETVLTTVHADPLSTITDGIIQAQTQFPYLHAGTAAFQPGAVLVYTFSCMQPVCRLNDRYLLLANGCVVDHVVFCDDAYASLPAIKVDRALLQDEQQLCAVAHAMTRIDSAITTVHTIYWYDVHTGFIVMQENPDYTIKFDVMRIPTIPMLAHCTTIHQELQNTTVSPRGGWITDIRFNNQIIVYRGKGGGYG